MDYYCTSIVTYRSLEPVKWLTLSTGSFTLDRFGNANLSTCCVAGISSSLVSWGIFFFPCCWTLRRCAAAVLSILSFLWLDNNGLKWIHLNFLFFPELLLTKTHLSPFLFLRLLSFLKSCSMWLVVVTTALTSTSSTISDVSFLFIGHWSGEYLSGSSNGFLTVVSCQEKTIKKRKKLKHER